MDTRREFMKKAALLSGGAGLTALLPASIARAMAIDPKAGSTYLDAEHVVFLMQENRSFDHTYGTLRGVRGFNDPRAITLADGLPVWYQSNKKGETFAPFRLDIKGTKATWMNSLPHSWTNQVDARNDGRMDQWLNVKHSGHPDFRDMPLTMGYYTREDIPFYYALADAFTVCDQHFCSCLTGTSPNRSFFWSGTIRQEQNEQSKPCVWNEDMDFGTLKWRTYPELLEQHNIPWKVYQNELSVPSGLEGEYDAWLTNFTDNNFEFYSQFNIHMHPGFQTWLRQRKNDLPAEIAEEEKALAAVPDSDPLKEKLTRKLAEKKKEYAGIGKYMVESDAFEKLTPFQQNIHKKAFSTNTGDEHYRTLTDFTYNDNGKERTMKLPKGDVLHQFRQDVDNGALPTVSWLVAPENFSDHPGAPWYGAWYVSEVMDILTKNPEVWKKTIFVLTYDENDGYFDHMPPFVAPNLKKEGTGKVTPGMDTSVEYVTREQRAGGDVQGGDEHVRESSIGLGFRVPLVIASPWTRGGFVNSEVFDHTSCLQFLEHFLEAKTGKQPKETNISDWRRMICGDLKSVFRSFDPKPMPAGEFVTYNTFMESVHQAQFRDLPSDFRRIDKGTLLTGGVAKVEALQEKGIRPSSALPYRPDVSGSLNEAGDQFVLSLGAAAPKQGRANAGMPFTVYAPGNSRTAGGGWEKMQCRSYGVATGTTVRDLWPMAGFEDSRYLLQIIGPNGFLTEFTGSKEDPRVEVRCGYETTGAGLQTGNLDLQLFNNDKSAITILIKDMSYGSGEKSVLLAPGAKKSVKLDLKKSHNWYDIAVTARGMALFRQRFAGRVETGKDGFSDPLMGGVA